MNGKFKYKDTSPKSRENEREKEENIYRYYTYIFGGKNCVNFTIK